MELAKYTLGPNWLSTYIRARIRTRLATEVATRDELLACLDHLLKSAGNATLMTKELRHTLVDHAAGNYRIFVSMAASCS